MKSILYKWLLRTRFEKVARVDAELAAIKERAAIERYQVEKFNALWSVASGVVPFYRNWKKQYSLPNQITSLDELKNWPILTKADLRQQDLFERTDAPRPTGSLMTGGSTGEPLHLPTWGDPLDGVSQIRGRRPYGVGPGTRTFLLWGHRHLYGKGFKRWKNTLKRNFKDWLANWKRVSAYDLSEQAMHRAFAQMKSFKPEFVIGFSAAILSFCRQNKAQARDIKSVRVVLCTAGPLTESEKIEIETFFNAKVCMEYGSVECAIMAYTRPQDGWYDVFWNTHLIQAVRQPDGEFKNIVTRFRDTYVPLIRYDIGDYLDLGVTDPSSLEKAERSVLELRSIKGRPTEMIHFACGVSFFGALIGDCVKQVPSVIASQLCVDEKDNELEIRVTASSQLSIDDLNLIKNRFCGVVADAAKLKLTVRQLDCLEMTIGGKTPRVVHAK